MTDRVHQNYKVIDTTVDDIFGDGPWELLIEGVPAGDFLTYRDAWETMRHVYYFRYEKQGYVIVLPGISENPPVPYTQIVPYNVLGLTLRKLENVNNIRDKGIYLCLLRKV